MRCFVKPQPRQSYALHTVRHLPALRLAEIASACREQVSAELTCHLQIPLFDSISEAWFEGGAQ